MKNECKCNKQVYTINLIIWTSKRRV